MKFPLQCFSKIITGTTGLLTALDSVQGGSGVVTVISCKYCLELFKCLFLSILQVPK
ncbi:hypothetical protein HanIR_Chr13g0655581 [Helianthus annuus]|nr:hypothetical protein HanIR_Chr13g0655581 [Helianthus annuus]